MVHFERYHTFLEPKSAPNDVHSDKYSVLFRSFLQLKAMNLFMIALLQTLQ